MQVPRHSSGTITLIGSGEMSPSLGRVHRAVMKRIAGPVRPVFLDTPAGFQLNADQIAFGAVKYFKRYLNLDLSVISFKSPSAVTPAKLAQALCELERANYIFAGPGSPTYAIRNWQGSAVLKAVAQRLALDAHLVFASAAAIAIGRFALPVYEIYKVGDDPCWVEGLDLLGAYGLELAIVPHWNNAEGGTHDTRHCFVGEPRMILLERALPDSTVILGIDEYTACTLDIVANECLVMGAGEVTIRQRGCADRRHSAGTTFALDEMGMWNSPGERRVPLEPRRSERKAIWPDSPDIPEAHAGVETPLIKLLVWTRTQVRGANQWALADEIRRRLAELGIVLEDGRTDTTWRRA